jgi:Fanconi anemia group M protein
LGGRFVDQTIILSYISKESREKPRIYVDSREASNRNGKRIVSLLYEFGTETIVKKLDVGDYLIGEDIAIERKTVLDLANTLTQRFLFDQIFKMKDVYPRSIVLIEGYMGLLRKYRRIRPESINGALFALIQANIPLVPTIDYKDTATFLATSAKQLQKNKKTKPIIRHKAKTKNILEQQLFVVAGLPYIGSVLGENLLRHFKTIRAILSSSKKELMEVKGIGHQKAEGILKILDIPYEDSKDNTTEGT